MGHRGECGPSGLREDQPAVDAEGGAFYGPRGLLEAAGGGVKHAKILERAKNEGDCRRLWEVSEQLTGATFPMPN